MKNYFITEYPTGNLTFGDNKRAVETWIDLLEAPNINILEFINDPKWLGGICWLIIPKGEKTTTALVEKTNELTSTIKKCFDKVYCVQEGETTFFQQYSVHKQLWLNLQLKEADRIYTQNEYDKKYFRGLLPESDVRLIRTMMDPTIFDESKFKQKEDAVILPGPMMTEYCGFEQAVISKETNFRVDIPPMGQSRMPKDSWDMAENVGVNYLDYMSWKEWNENLSRYKIGYFLVQAIGAASFPLNCAYQGIPCIGDARADTQRILFPDLSIDYLDLEKARELTRKLWIDEEFYLYCSNKAKEQYLKEFNKQRFFQLLETK